MSTPSLQLHRAHVHSADPVTGYCQVRIPGLLSYRSLISVPPVGLPFDGNRWIVPEVGSFGFVAVTPDYDQYYWVTGIDALDEEGLPGNEPIGHEDRTESVLEFDIDTYTLTISPVNDSYVVWCVGKRYVKTAPESVTFDPADTGLYYVYFDTNGVLQYKNSFFTWDQDTPTAYVYLNTDSNGLADNYMLFDERHGITMDWATHEYLHRTRGASIANGFNLTGRDYSEATLTTLDGSSDEHAQIEVANGTFFDEDLRVSVTHSASPTANTFEQVLELPAEVPIIQRWTYGWIVLEPTTFPITKTTPLGSVFTRAVYNGYDLTGEGLFWSSKELGNGDFGVMYLVATNRLNYPVMVIMGQAAYNNIGQAEAADWSDLDLDGLPIVEMRPLYKLIFQTAAYSNSVNAVIRKVEDIRRIQPSILDIAT